MPADGRSQRRAGWLAVTLGLGLALAVQVSAPVGVPLYDGVVVTDPYRHLHPAAGQDGDPTTFTESVPIDEDVSPILIAATLETPPQAQLIAQKDAFELTPGATSIEVSITPIEPPAVHPGGQIAGNVYRFSVTDQSGAALVPRPCSGCRSLVLRAPDGVVDGTVKRFSGDAWVDLETIHAGVVAMYQANPTELGDYAIISGSTSGGGLDPTLLVLGGGIVLVVLAFVVLIYLRQRPPPAYPTRRSGAARPGLAGRIPSKRRGPRRPPSGRSDQ
jgi:hypothetical protein